MEEEILYEKEGYVQDNIAAIIILIVGVGVSALVLIFVSVLSGQTYSLTESDIESIGNETIRNYTKEGIVSSFQALKSTGQYLPIVVLAVIITIILGLIIGLTGGMGFGGNGSYYGGAL
jgi:hypothetical protein